MLRDGIQANRPGPFVHAALIFALSLGTEEDWHLADGLMKLVPPAGVAPIQRRWSYGGHRDSLECMLVHYFLLRHHKIDRSGYGTAEAMSRRLAAGIATFPEWLRTAPRFSSLAEVFENFLQDDFEDSLTAYLAEMPRNRASAQEILEEMGQWDEWLLYQALLQDFRGFLTKEEMGRVTEDYTKKFSVPLSAIMDGKPDEGGTESAKEE